MADLNVMGVVVKGPAGLAEPGNVVLPGVAAVPMALSATSSARGVGFAARRGPDDQRVR